MLGTVQACERRSDTTYADTGNTGKIERKKHSSRYRSLFFFFYALVLDEQLQVFYFPYNLKYELNNY